RIVGHRDVPGHPAMYGTTRQFLDYFNLKGLDDLPTLMELRDIDSINAELELALPGESLPLPGEDAEQAGEETEEDVVIVQVASDTPENNETIH
ncbi:MAG TPA: SMC-Scp complex subunit ScpB, partial [Gammaproteobacteria bacterium]|nr:SMC-Scp complex subunit ScpB [Gammaproteobacteria bacterium]